MRIVFYCDFCQAFWSGDPKRVLRHMHYDEDYEDQDLIDEYDFCSKRCENKFRKERGWSNA
jgi:hypothetical protein